MATKKSHLPYRMKTDPEIRHAIDNILSQLELYGRAFTSNGTASRVLSRYFSEPVNNGHIYFTWNKKHEKSIITIPPSIHLTRTKDNRIRFDMHQSPIKPKKPLFP